MTLHTDRIDVVAVLEVGEVAAKQLTPDCAAFAAKLDARVADTSLRWAAPWQDL